MGVYHWSLVIGHWVAVVRLSGSVYIAPGFCSVLTSLPSSLTAVISHRCFGQCRFILGDEVCCSGNGSVKVEGVGQKK